MSATAGAIPTDIAACTASIAELLLVETPKEPRGRLASSYSRKLRILAANAHSPPDAALVDALIPLGDFT